jgi:HemY protein
MRLFLFLLFLVILSLLAVWVANHPGRVVLDWGVYRVDTSVAVLVGGAALLVVIALLVYRVTRFLWYGPREFARARAERREKRGYLALTRGLVTAAAGDAKGARRLARRANALLGEPPLTLLLSAQAAQLEGDDKAAAAYFTAMLERRETEFLGLRGLLVEARKAGDRDKALELAKRAYALKPTTPWVLETLLDLQARAGEWLDAEATLKAARQSNVIAGEAAKRRRVLFLCERAKAAARSDQLREAEAFAKQAHGLDPAFVPAALLAAERALAAGEGERARKVITTTWARSPHPELARMFVDSLRESPAIERMKWVEKLVQPVAEHPESRLALAEAMLKARLWGLARSELEAAEKLRPGARVYRLMAELEESEHGDAEKAREWLIKASGAPPEPLWVCAECGSLGGEWRMYCPNCEAVDSLRWREPPAVQRLAGSGPEPERPAAAPQAPRSRLASWLGGRRFQPEEKRQ